MSKNIQKINICPLFVLDSTNFSKIDIRDVGSLWYSKGYRVAEGSPPTRIARTL